nr:EamA family transporter RarD [Moraxella sp.]
MSVSSVLSPSSIVVQPNATTSQPATPAKKLRFGVVLALISNMLFGVLYLYSHWLAPLSGTQVFLWRMVAMWFGLVGLLAMTQSFGQLKAFLMGLNKQQWVLLLLPTPILASQLWLFMWAPINGQAVNTAMGYFLLPLMMVLMGCVVFKETLNRLQWAAIIVAAAGVGLQFWLAGSVSWATAWVCLTYPIYYGLRRWQGVPALMGLFVDLSVIAPIALGFLLWQNSSISIVTGSMTMGLLLIGLGMISALAMQTNLKASQVLPMNTFGMLSYLEPALMFLLSIFVLHEAVNGTMIASFALIWVGVLLMIVNAMRASKNNHSTAICD